mgnify:CR=1 FL=1
MARKKKELPLLEKVTIMDVAAEGKAIAKVNDLVIFVPYVVPGDVVDLQIKRKKNKYAEAEAVNFHEYWYNPDCAGYKPNYKKHHNYRSHNFSLPFKYKNIITAPSSMWPR